MGVRLSIKQESYHRNANVRQIIMKNTVTQDHINDILSKSEFRVGTVFDKATVLHVKLPNGFVLTAESACVDPENYDQQLGKALCEKKIVDKLWELEGYVLQSMIYNGIQSLTAEQPVERIARVAHEINAAYCRALGDDSQPSWDDAPEWQKESAINGVQAHLANPDMTPEQSHENWLREKYDTGWKYGEVKDPEAKTHPCIQSYDKLPAEQRAKDHIFKSVVDAMR